MRKKGSNLIIFCVIDFLCCISCRLSAQSVIPSYSHNNDSLNTIAFHYYNQQKDLIDIFNHLFHINQNRKLDTAVNRDIPVYFTIAPIVEYTIATGFSPGVAGNVAFKTSDKKKTNVSSILAAIKYTEKQQFMLPVQSTIWTPGNKFNLIGDWRYYKYPQDAFGIGAYTTEADKYIISYNYVRFYEQIIRRISNSIYLGYGYQLDYHWHIKEEQLTPGRITDFQKYGFTETSTSSGINVNVSFDNRENSINPNPGSFYANLQFIQNSTLLGANSNYSSVIMDFRKYISVPLNTLLAVWFYSVITLKGSPPYLDLPGMGTDMYNNTGRGYEQSRFIGKKFIDLEAELRFKISRNGLVGGVIFANASSVSEMISNRFEVISPGVGVGLRIKFNKFSNTNACIDFGKGRNGSGGFVGNLGEVF